MATTKNTRLFLGLTGGVLALGVAAGLAVSYGRPGARGPVGTLTSDLRYLPADAGLVASVNVRALHQSPLHRAWASRHRSDRHPDAPLMRLGLRLETEVEALLVASAAVSGAGLRPDALVLVRGPVDTGLLQVRLAAQGGHASDYKGIRVIRFGGGEMAPLTVALLSPGLLAVGRSDTVTLSIDGVDGVNLTSNESLMRAIGGVADGDVWAVGRVDAATSDNRFASLPPLTWFAATARLSQGLEGSIRAEAREQKGADNIRDLLQGLVALARVQTERRPELAAAVNSLQLTMQGTVVTLSFAVPSGDLPALMPVQPDGTGPSAPRP